MVSTCRGPVSTLVTHPTCDRGGCGTFPPTWSRATLQAPPQTRGPAGRRHPGSLKDQFSGRLAAEPLCAARGNVTCGARTEAPGNHVHTRVCMCAHVSVCACAGPVGLLEASVALTTWIPDPCQPLRRAGAQRQARPAPGGSAHPGAARGGPSPGAAGPGSGKAWETALRTPSEPLGRRQGPRPCPHWPKGPSDPQGPAPSSTSDRTGPEKRFPKVPGEAVAHLGSRDPARSPHPKVPVPGVNVPRQSESPGTGTGTLHPRPLGPWSPVTRGASPGRFWNACCSLQTWRGAGSSLFKLQKNLPQTPADPHWVLRHRQVPGCSPILTAPPAA